MLNSESLTRNQESQLIPRGWTSYLPTQEGRCHLLFLQESGFHIQSQMKGNLSSMPDATSEDRVLLKKGTVLNLRPLWLSQEGPKVTTLSSQDLQVVAHLDVGSMGLRFLGPHLYHVIGWEDSRKLSTKCSVTCWVHEGWWHDKKNHSSLLVRSYFPESDLDTIQS